MIDTFVKKIANITRYSLLYPIEKLLNTLFWIIKPHSKIVVANVYLRHVLGYIYKENLGDDLNYYLVRKLSGKSFVNYLHSYLSTFNPINYMCIGSIVRRSNGKSIIWGSGAMFDNLEGMEEKPLKVLAVRGPLTRNLLLRNGIECPPIYGDPAILFPYLYSSKKEKKYRLGIIPHIFDYSDARIKEIEERKEDDVVIIRMSNYKDWRNVIDLINECEFIASSSLHGLILSDAYQVPNVWIKLSDKVLGGDFKFLDYFQGCGKSDITKPIDYSTRDVDLEDLLTYKYHYIKPTYQVRQLLDVCPFADKSIISSLEAKFF